MRLKDVAELVNEKSEQTDLRYVALENVASWDGTFVETDATTDGVNNRFMRGDVLFGKLRPYLAKGFLPDFSGICSTEFFVLRPRKPLIGKFLLYYLLSPGFIDAINHQTAGVKMPRTDWSSFGAMPFSLPPLPEQRRIVAFLDEKTAAIDKRIALLERKRDTLKRLKKSVIHHAVTRGLDPDVPLKESGMEWIGKIPQGWIVKQAKHCVRIDHGSDPQTEGDIPVYGSGSGSFKTCGEFKNGPTVLLGRKGATLHIPHYVDGRFWNVDTAFNVSVKHGFFLRFYYYCATDFDYKFYLSQTTLPSMTQSDYENMLLRIPPFSEQRAIADYLDTECAKIDAMVQTIEKQIDACRRLKRALIDEVVTGRRKVP